MEPKHLAAATPALTLLVTVAQTLVQTPSQSVFRALALGLDSLAGGWLSWDQCQGADVPLCSSVGGPEGLGGRRVSKACFTCCSHQAGGGEGWS